MRRSCRLARVFEAFVVVCLMPVATWAQTTNEERPVGSLREGDWGLQFQIIENFTLTSFDGLMISLERHWSPRSAFRLGFDVAVGTTDQHFGTSDDSDSLLSRFSVQDRTGNSENVALKLQYVAYSNPEARLHFYWATGPAVSYGRSHYETDGEANVPGGSTIITETEANQSWGTSLTGAVGVLWFAARGLGLLAEYGAAAGYEFSKATRDRTQQTTGVPLIRTNSDSEQHRFLLDSLGVRFGVSILF